MDLTVVGISAHYHDAACCLLRGGRLVSAAQEERFTRVKHDPSLPVAAFRWCLEQGEVDISEIDCIAYYELPKLKWERQRWAAAQIGGGAALPCCDPERPEREIRELLGFEGKIAFVPHHLSHAASSFYFSGFEEAALLVVDGVGEWATTSYGEGVGANLQLFDEVRFPHSLGLLYSTITAYLGFEVNDGEYKVMGLAPYGRPTYADEMRRLLHLGDAGQYQLAMEYFAFLDGRRMYSPLLCELFGQPARAPESEITDFACDVARSLQVVLEETLLALVEHLHRRVPRHHLCLSGGVALNCVANSRILRDGPFRHLFVQPAAGDAGGALGAAAVAHTLLTGKRPPGGQLDHVFWGPAYSHSRAQDLLRSTSARFQDYHGRQADLLADVARRLADGEVVCWQQGRMEFGPRSLGARSILADPRRPEMRDRVNALVKQREAFRPFAPAVLAGRARAYFDLDHPSPFMLETCQVVSLSELPAITHVDGSARVQTVDPAVAPRFAALLSAFESQTGCPVLLNTSFNLRGEPIVCTPLDALMCFARSGADCLVLEDLVLDRRDLPDEWTASLGSLPRGRPAISAEVYTLC